MRKISETKWHEETTYHHEFDHRDHPGAGFSFECDKDGNVLNPESDNYRKCLDGTHDGANGVDQLFRETAMADDQQSKHGSS